MQIFSLSTQLFNHIAELRKEIGFPQIVLAERSGISREYLYRIEKCQVVPSVLIALRIAECLGVKVEEAFSMEKTSFLTKEEKFDLYLEETLKKDREKKESWGA